MISQLYVERLLLQRGCQLFRPVLESNQIDLVVLTPHGRYWRMQIKTAQWLRPQGRRPVIRVDLRRKSRTPQGVRLNGKHYDQVDVFCVVDGDSYWVIPFLPNRSTVNLGQGGMDYRENWSLMGLE